MIILPAIDIKNGQCVRLFKGEFDTVHKVAESPIVSAENFKNKGAEFLHVVDLDGALEKKPVNHEIIKEIASLGVPVEVGGGIRSVKDIEMYVNNGIKRVILGSVALKQPEFVKEAVKEFGKVIAVGIDADNGYVKTEGWIDTSDMYFTEFAKMMQDCGVDDIIYTDISKDGTLSGVNGEHLKQLKDILSIKITASGGVRDMADIKLCKELGLYGAICGKSLYSGTLDLEEALECCRKE